MKHIFWIHSHITYLLSKTIIETENIDDYLFLQTRAYKIPDYYSVDKVVDFPFYYTPKVTEHSIISGFNLFKTFRNLKKCKQLISELTGNLEFILYTPLFSQPAIQLFINKDSCIGFYYIEEGTASYKPLDILNDEKKSFKSFFKKIYYCLLPLSYKNSRLFFNINHRKLNGTYSFFEDAFKWNTKAKHILRLTIDSKVDKMEVDAFLFFDALVEYKLVSETDFLKVLNDSIKYFIDNNIQRLAYKFHPEQLKNPMLIEKIKFLFHKHRNNLKIVELNSNFIAELYFLQHKSIVYVFLSSVGLYAKKNNSKVISLVPFFKNYDYSFYKNFEDSSKID